jgi:hypothetical protein
MAASRAYREPFGAVTDNHLIDHARRVYLREFPVILVEPGIFRFSRYNRRAGAEKARQTKLLPANSRGATWRPNREFSGLKREFARLNRYRRRPRAVPPVSGERSAKDGLL